MKFLVTGGLGYVGSVFAELATKAGHQCLVIDRDQSKKDFFARTEVVIADITDADAVSRMVAKYKPHIVHHFAAISTVGGHPDSIFAENVITTYNLLTAIKDRSPQTGFVFASSCAVYGNQNHTGICFEDTPLRPVSSYERSKLECERVIADFSTRFALNTMILRYSNVGGAGELRKKETHLIPNLILAAINEEPVTLFGKGLPTKDGSYVRDYVHVQDIVETHLLASTHLSEKKQNRCYNLGASTSHSNLEVVAEVELVSGKKLQLEQVATRKGDPVAIYLDNNRARHELGFVPRHSSLKEIVTNTWHWLQTEKYRRYMLLL